MYDHGFTKLNCRVTVWPTGAGRGTITLNDGELPMSPPPPHLREAPPEGEGGPGRPSLRHAAAFQGEMVSRFQISTYCQCFWEGSVRHPRSLAQGFKNTK